MLDDDRKKYMMGGSEKEEEKRIGYSDGNFERTGNIQKDFVTAYEAEIKRTAKQLSEPQEPKGMFGKAVEKVIGNDAEGFLKMAARDSARTARQIPGVRDEYKSEDNFIKKVNAQIKNMKTKKVADKVVSEVRKNNYGGGPNKRKGYAEGSLLEDDMAMTQENDDMLTMSANMEPSTETDMDSDNKMEEGYLNYILGEALSENEEDMLMSKLEQDGELSILFDKVIDVAQEFAGSGPVEGPGTGVSDSIPARLSDGEFVFTAKAVEEIGEDVLMSMMKEAEDAAGEREGFESGEIVSKDDEIEDEESNVSSDMRTVNPRLNPNTR